MLFLATTKYVHVLTAAGLHVRGISSDRDSERDSNVHVLTAAGLHVRGISSDRDSERDSDVL